MLKGNLINLQLVTEKRLDEYYAHYMDISNRGEYFPLQVRSEPIFKAKFRESGFWTDEMSKLLIMDHEDNMIGSIWAMKTVPYFNALEIGYIIYDKNNYGKGYMTEALSLFSDYLFKTKLINRLEIRIVPGHAASEKVALKCGFEFEGVIRGAFFHQGKHCNLRQFSLLRQSYSLAETPRNH